MGSPKVSLLTLMTLTWSDWPFWRQIFFKISGFRIHPSKANFCNEWQDSNIFMVISCWILQLLINKSFNLETSENLTISWTDGIQTDFRIRASHPFSSICWISVGHTLLPESVTCFHKDWSLHMVLKIEIRVGNLITYSGLHKINLLWSLKNAVWTAGLLD